MSNEKYPLIFIVEDNSVYNKLIVNHLRSHKFIRVESFLSGEECMKNIHRRPDIVIQDYLLEGMNGLDVLIETKKQYPDTEFIFLSGQEDMDIAITSMRHGAFDYIFKDQYALKKLSDRINRVMITHELIKSNRRYKNGITIFVIALIALILLLISLSFLFPKTFSF